MALVAEEGKAFLVNSRALIGQWRLHKNENLEEKRTRGRMELIKKDLLEELAKGTLQVKRHVMSRHSVLTQPRVNATRVGGYGGTQG